MVEAQFEILGTFDKCRVCGSKRRLMDELVKEQAEEGEIPDNTNPCLQMISAVAANPVTLATALIGATFPTGVAIVDACLDCGTLYAVSLLKGSMKTTAQMPQQGMPGFPPAGGMRRAS